MSGVVFSLAHTPAWRTNRQVDFYHQLVKLDHRKKFFFSSEHLEGSQAVHKG
jgi:hypothetical protein